MIITSLKIFKNQNESLWI